MHDVFCALVLGNWKTRRGEPGTQIANYAVSDDTRDPTSAGRVRRAPSPTRAKRAPTYEHAPRSAGLAMPAWRAFCWLGCRRTSKQCARFERGCLVRGLAALRARRGPLTAARRSGRTRQAGRGAIHRSAAHSQGRAGRGRPSHPFDREASRKSTAIMGGHWSVDQCWRPARSPLCGAWSRG